MKQNDITGNKTTEIITRLDPKPGMGTQSKGGKNLYAQINSKNTQNSESVEA